MFQNVSQSVKGLFWVNVFIFILCLTFQMFNINLSHIFALYSLDSPNFYFIQFITYMFLHGGFMHLLFNMLALVTLGSVCEDELGSRKFLLFYFIMGIGASILQLIFSSGPMVGASGAIYGILAYHTLLNPETPMFPFGIKIKYLTVIFLIFELYCAFFSIDNIAHFAHLGGALTGLILYFLNKNIPILKNWS